MTGAASADSFAITDQDVRELAVGLQDEALTDVTGLAFNPYLDPSVAAFNDTALTQLSGEASFGDNMDPSLYKECECIGNIQSGDLYD